MKVNGAELLQWMEEAWPGDDWYWDHDCFEEPNPDATYDTHEIGGVYFQGEGDDPTKGDGYDLSALIRKWRKERTCTTLMVTVPKDRVDAVTSSIRAMGLKVR